MKGMKLLRVRFNVPKPISVREPMIPDKNGKAPYSADMRYFYFNILLVFKVPFQ